MLLLMQFLDLLISRLKYDPTHISNVLKDTQPIFMRILGKTSNMV